MLRGSVAHSALHKFYAGPAEGARPRPRRRPRTSSARVGFLRRCLDDALRGGVRLELTDLQAARARRRASGATSRASSATRRARRSSSCRAASRSGSARSARRPSCSAASTLGDGLYLSGKIDRIDVDPFSARGIVQDYKSGTHARTPRQQIDDELKLQIPLYMLVLRDLVGIEPLGGVYRALAGARMTRGLLRAERRRTTCRASRRTTTSPSEEFWALVETSRDARARLRAAHPRGRRARTTRRAATCPSLVRPLDDVPGAERP